MPTKKKQSKQLKFANVTGRKKVLLVTMLALVVVGAGIIIRSFAASTDSIYTYGNGYLTPRGGTKAQTMTVDDAKNPQAVLVMPVAVSNGVVSAATAGTDKTGILANTKFQICVKASGVAPNNVYVTAWIHLNSSSGNVKQYGIGGPYLPAPSITPATNGFNLICSQTYQESVNLYGPIDFYNNNVSNSTINVYSFVIRTITPDTPATPAPTK